MSLVARMTPECCKELYRRAHARIPMGWRRGREYRKYARLLGDSQWWTPKELRQMQDEKLQELINHCYRHVPYYRSVMGERRLRPEDIRTRADLQKLPFLTKKAVKERFEELKADKSEAIVRPRKRRVRSPVEDSPAEVEQEVEDAPRSRERVPVDERTPAESEETE